MKIFECISPVEKLMQVPAFLLRLSEVWEVMADESESIMISEDGVVTPPS